MAAWRAAISGLVASELPATPATVASSTEAGPPDAAAWAESIRALAGAGTSPVAFAPPRAAEGAPAGDARDLIAALRDALAEPRSAA